MDVQMQHLALMTTLQQSWMLQVKLLEGSATGDQFGRDVIPHALDKGYTVIAHHFDGYWRVSPKTICSLKCYARLQLSTTTSGTVKACLQYAALAIAKEAT